MTHRKNIMLSIVSLFLSISNCQGQVEIGLQFGFNNSTPVGSDFNNVNDAQSDFGLNGGIVALFPLGNSGLYLETGVGYSKNKFGSVTKEPLLAANPGWYFDENGNSEFDFDEPGAEWGDLSYHRDYSLSSFSIPLGFIYKLGAKKLNLYFELGSDFNIITSGELLVDLKDANGGSSSPTTLFYTALESTTSYLDFYKNSDVDGFRDFGGHEKKDLFYAEELTLGSANDNYFNNLLISGYAGTGIYIDLFHGDIYFGARYHQGLNSINQMNTLDNTRPESLNKLVVSVKYTIDLVL